MKNNKVVVILFLLSFVNTDLIACRCEDSGTVKESFDNTPLLIYGEVISFDYVSIEDTMNPNKAEEIRKELNKERLIQFESKFVIKVDVKIIKQYKGNEINDVTIVYTTRTDASCGYREFKKGEEFIIYAYEGADFYYSHYVSSIKKRKGLEREGTYWTSHCTRTKSFNKAEFEELESLCN